MLLPVLVVCGLALTVAGCNDTAESDAYQQLMAGGANRGGTSAGESGQALSGGKPAIPGAEATEEQTEDGEAAESSEPIDNVVIEEVQIEAPYPEFDGEGRYDVKVTVVLKEFEDAQVYRIAALDEEGNEVGSQEKHLKLPLRKARSFDFNEFYCTHMPVTVAFFRTDKTAVAAGESEGEGGEVVGRGVGTETDDGDSGTSSGRGFAGGA